MLKPACAWFLRRARAGVDSRHRQRCSSCDAYVSAIEDIGELRLSLPADLDRRLRSIPRVIPSYQRRRAATLPTGLRERLSAILPPARPTLPRFAGSPLYAVVASYLVVLAVGAFWGDPYQIVQPTFSSVRSSTSEALAQTGDTVSSWMREARTELQLRGDNAAQFSNELLQKLEDKLTLPTRTGKATRNGDPDDNS